jgi:hypothetical protein
MYSPLLGNEDFPATLYHYTSVDGLLGILRSKRIWATDIRFLNDRSEFFHAMEEYSKHAGHLAEQALGDKR